MTDFTRGRERKSLHKDRIEDERGEPEAEPQQAIFEYSDDQERGAGGRWISGGAASMRREATQPHGGGEGHDKAQRERREKPVSPTVQATPRDVTGSDTEGARREAERRQAERQVDQAFQSAYTRRKTALEP